FGRAGIAVRTIDLAIEPLDEDAVRAARFVGVSVPMHTAMRLALPPIRRVRALAPEATVALYGLYAPLHRDLALQEGVRVVLGGEHEEDLVRAAQAALAGGLDAPLAPEPVL